MADPVRIPAGRSYGGWEPFGQAFLIRGRVRLVSDPPPVLSLPTDGRLSEIAIPVHSRMGLGIAVSWFRGANESPDAGLIAGRSVRKYAAFPQFQHTLMSLTAGRSQRVLPEFIDTVFRDVFAGGIFRS